VHLSTHQLKQPVGVHNRVLKLLSFKDINRHSIQDNPIRSLIKADPIERQGGNVPSYSMGSG
jgi:hypothetical protein